MIDKVTAVRSIIKDLGGPEALDLIFCVGDGKMEEENIFTYLNELRPLKGGVDGAVDAAVEGAGEAIADASSLTTFTATVGKKQSEAKYYLDSVKDVGEILHALANSVSG
jgi:trehalose 6-phosphate synthase/phosphatase